MTLPPIDDWWSDLSPDAQQSVLDSDSHLLDEAVREEIRVLTGAVVGMVEQLSGKDLAYARAHTASKD
ncbi:hypothetical protein [Microbacterium sp. TPD7012]|uniref:hypothetical protein n=1 Tax=Microbacterium sp. TPD7012 TaxID=2171975 RepID=UPI000D50FED3|nr:hypothetical protein [Microbacterium sp. TPD7012]PVE92305.1 hypothetical protein DC434_17510 [Microbacterium sp. TPD7012]